MFQQFCKLALSKEGFLLFIKAISLIKKVIPLLEVLLLTIGFIGFPYQDFYSDEAANFAASIGFLFLGLSVAAGKVLNVLSGWYTYWFKQYNNL